MDVTPPALESYQARNGLGVDQNPEQQQHGDVSEHMHNASGQFMPPQLASLDGLLKPSHEDATSVPNLQSCETPQDVVNQPKKRGRKKKIVPPNPPLLEGCPARNVLSIGENSEQQYHGDVSEHMHNGSGACIPPQLESFYGQLKPLHEDATSVPNLQSCETPQDVVNQPRKRGRKKKIVHSNLLPLESCQARNGLSIGQNPGQQHHGDVSEHMRNGSGLVMPLQLDSFDGQMRPSHEDAKNVANLQSFTTPQDAVNHPRKWGCKRENVPSNYVSSSYALRSSLDATRIQSKTDGACETSDTCTNSVDASTERNPRRRGRKRVLKDVFSSLRKRFRYLLTRMGYQQSLIEAYSGEGWKGQSLEKLKPEKELQRATSEILRCKMEMRELLKHLDELCAEGRLQDSLFDSQGQIYSEDIFCSKCGSKDLSTGNDIILCDGICSRGFHQMCLVPPLLTDEIPPGDEIWLCPGCKCKVYCIDLLNDVQGTHLSIQDKWEKVFPEAASDKQCLEIGLPSDDSEDNDYDPEGQELDEEIPEEDANSDESNFSSASDYLSASASSPKDEGLGFSSEDLEDNDYNPDGPDIDEKVQKEGSSSDESDFSSDSDDLSALNDVDESLDLDEAPLSLSASCSELTNPHKKSETTMKENQVISGASEQLPVLGKRNREQLDYKKLHDDAYGNIPSDSSEDEDWSETKNTPKKGKVDNVTKILGDSSKPCTENKVTRSGHKSFGTAISQRLYESLRVNAYPTRETKESLSKELGITTYQVSSWFANTRRSLRVAANRECNNTESVITNNEIPVTNNTESGIIKNESPLTKAGEMDVESINGGGEER